MTRIWNQNRTFLTASGLSLALLFSSAGCKKNPTSTDSSQVADTSGSDPADINIAPPEQGGTPTMTQPARVLGTSQQGSYTQQGESYPQGSPAPIERQAPQADDSDQYASDVDAGQVALTAPDPPPPLPEYDQPPAPEPDDLWTPGYWDYSNSGYYWVPGAWVAAPYYGALWTPPWWGFYGGHYGFHRGYWGRHIGFYGGVNYGFGYVGHGYEGGYWHDNHFVYNTAVNRINTTVIHNTYVHNVTIVNNTRVSYNGGRGGLNVRPQPSEIAALHENHTPPMQTQVQHAQQAGQNRAQFFSANHGRPAIAVAARPIAAVHQEPPAPAQRGGFGQQARPNEQPARPEPHRNTPQQQPQRVEPQQARPQQQPQRTEPQARPQPQRQAEPQQARPTPQQQARPEPQPRPEQQARPQPTPQAHPEPQPRPQPQHAPPAPHPAPQARQEQARPEQAHPEPQHPGGEEHH